MAVLAVFRGFALFPLFPLFRGFRLFPGSFKPKAPLSLMFASDVSVRVLGVSALIELTPRLATQLFPGRPFDNVPPSELTLPSAMLVSNA